jgi:hypothetical protein
LEDPFQESDFERNDVSALPNAPNLTHIGFKVDDHAALAVAMHEDVTL